MPKLIESKSNCKFIFFLFIKFKDENDQLLILREHINEKNLIFECKYMINQMFSAVSYLFEINKVILDQLFE